MSFITSIPQKITHDIAYLIERAQKGIEDDTQAQKTISAVARIFLGVVMASTVIGFVASALTANVGGMVATVAFFVIAHEAFKFLEGREYLIDHPADFFIQSSWKGMYEALKNLSVEKGKDAALKDACRQQVKGSLLSPIWVEIQMALFKNGRNPFPYTFQEAKDS